MSHLTPIDPESHLWASWVRYKNSEDFANTEYWASHPQHRTSSLWAVYAKGYAAAEDSGQCPLIALVAVTICGFGVGLVTGILW